MKEELKKIKEGFYTALFFVAIMWIVRIAETVLGADWGIYGVLPREVSGLRGILFSPFLHADFYHLFNNSLPLLVLGSMLFYFYRGIAWEVGMVMFFMSGFWLWIVGRPVYHIGASGLVYALTGFLFFSGVFRKNAALLTLSLLVVFLYGSLIWGIFPIDLRISWEGHLAGGIAGAIVAWYYRKAGPKNPEPIVLEEPDDSNPYWLTDDHSTEGQQPQEPERPNIFIRYVRPDRKDD